MKIYWVEGFPQLCFRMLSHININFNIKILERKLECKNILNVDSKYPLLAIQFSLNVWCGILDDQLVNSFYQGKSHF